ncbi:hypothetical protein NQ318_005496 [Aromia moschata]|uniref:DUF4371 domain-containing protein n=1 Tax=Aromia moschata TaxID=1265417 RepID=A0AAV8XPN1_9CUCU|nr:hypothetical protein NQ318_005496 [Aromia moschata]
MDQKIHEELLFARTLTTDAKGESIFNVFKDYFMEKAIPSLNITSVASDGAPAMVGRYRGFVRHLKQDIPGVCENKMTRTSINCSFTLKYTKHLNRRRAISID